MKKNPTKLKPIHVMNQEGLSNLEKRAVIDGASELIDLTKVNGIKIIDLDVWRNKNYRNEDRSLKPYQSVDWYIQKSKEGSQRKNQLNATNLQINLISEPWRNPKKGGQDHYDIFIINTDMYFPKTNFVIGSAEEGIGTVISTYRFKELDNNTKYECIKTETMHELGHVFGLIPNNRKENIEYSLGKHCTNICVMRQGLTLPTDWIKMSKDRLKYGPLCKRCEKDLKALLN